ncbi:MAG TPA: hypothetical protein PKA44_12975, partial [Saprospiraceae bacterium]|nr:hypothetical protein [Saprospiraceae bacterium]
VLPSVDFSKPLIYDFSLSCILKNLSIMSSDVNVYEEIVKLNMRISCMESLMQHILKINPNLNVPSHDEVDAIYAAAIQQVIDDVDQDISEG